MNSIPLETTLPTLVSLSPRHLKYQQCAISKQWFGKHISTAKDTNTTTEEWRFLCGPCQDVISRTVWSKQLVVRCSCRQLSWVKWHEVAGERESSVVRYQQFRWVKWRKVAGWWVREFSCQFSWKSACEEKTRRLMQNGRQPGTHLAELSVGKNSAQATATRGPECRKLKNLLW
jgi:hypothetical protein